MIFDAPSLDIEIVLSLRFLFITHTSRGARDDCRDYIREYHGKISLI